MSEEIIRMSIKVDSSDAKRAANDVDGLARSGKDADSTFQSATRTIKVFAGALALGATFRAITNATIEQERVTAQLDAVLRSTGGAAGYAKQELLDMASELQKVSTFGDEAIISAQTRLLSYSGIIGSQFPRALQNVLDQSARLNISLEQSAEIIGKALENPLKAAGALSRQGFAAAFTEEVEATIEALVKAGKEADAQALIMEVLEESYGGAAKAARDTLGGALVSLKGAFGDLLEGDSGGEGVNGARQAVEDLIKVLEDPNTKEAFGAVVSGVVDLITVTANGIVAINDFGKAIRANLWNPDLDRQIEELETRISGLVDEINRPRLLRINPLASTESIGQEIHNLRQELARLQAAREALANTPQGDQGGSEAVTTLASNIRILTEAEVAAAKAAEELAKAREKQLAQIDRQIAALEMEAATMGMGRLEAERYRLTMEGATAAQIAAAEAALSTIGAFEAQAVALADQTAAAEAYHALMAEMDINSGIAELDRLMVKHQQRQEIIRAALDAEYITKHEHDLRMQELDAQTNEQREQLIADHAAEHERLAVQTMASVLSITSTQVNQMAGLFDEASGIGKAFFITSKALAAANAVVAGLQASMAIRAAYALMAPMSGLGAPAVIAAGEVHANVAKAMGFATGAAIAAQAVASFDGGGFTGFGPRSGGVDGKGGFPAILHPNETVIDHTKGQGAGMSVEIHNYGNDQVRVERDGMSLQVIIEQVEKHLSSGIASGQGLLNKTIERSLDAPRRIG